MPSGLLVIAPSQISHMSSGPDEGHEVLFLLSDLMRHAPDDVAPMGADEWEFGFAIEDMDQELRTPLPAPMGEVLEGIM